MTPSAILMQIIEYIAYGYLVLSAIAYTIGVRTQLGVGIQTILGALFFILAALALYILKISKIHALWLLPSGFFFMMSCNFIISARIPLLSGLLIMVGSLYSALVRIGIPKEKIEAAQHSSNTEAVKNWLEQSKD